MRNADIELDFARSTLEIFKEKCTSHGMAGIVKEFVGIKFGHNTPSEVSEGNDTISTIEGVKCPLSSFTSL